ncbi:MAG: cbb3-type cytochrome c oxidase subunit I [Candidatus Latescibacteria bacterium]|nr:cbb3-type cytochrome c oxidase subunit I [Candidatus Latescibacterota bacterium]
MSEAVSISPSHDTASASYGFVRTYLFSLDHKMIGKQFLWFGLIMLFLGGFLALLIRWQLGYPETQVPGMGMVPESVWDEGESWLARTLPYGVIGPELYNALVTMHATIMVFFVVAPILVGCFGNFLIPLMIGTDDMAFPVLNMLSFWITIVAGVVLLASFFVEGGAAATGWTAYAPLSVKAIYTGVDAGQDLWCVSLIVLGIGSLLGAINYITTIVNMRTEGMTYFRMPLTIWSLLIVAILLLLAMPVLTTALTLLLFDRTLGTSFFLTEGGGEPILWQHLFWFFGHPEVYILILPAMGIVSDILSVFSRKPIFGYHAMVYAMLAIAFLGWIVWGHHMFQSGMSPLLGTTFMVSTMVIAVPSAIKTFNWLGTLYRGSIQLTTPMMHSLAFVSMFVVGGLSGIYMTSTPVDIYIHDTFFIVAHIHYVVFGGSIFGIFAAIHYWFPKMFGRMMNETLGKIHFVLTFLAFNGTFFPMHILGVGGHMRRLYNPMQYDFLQPLQPINELITTFAWIMGFTQFLLIVNVVWSLWKGPRAGKNPWQANTLEWTATSPPPHGNFSTPPVVYRGPYEYSVHQWETDFLPQNQAPDKGR